MISKRLIEVSTFTKGFNTLLDVGTDHAFLPIYALEKGFIKSAVASDINELPLENAKKNINEANLLIETVLYNGIPDTNADVISICGMGGELIIQILESTLKNAKEMKRLILAPNTDVKMVRKYICENNFVLVDESIVKEKNHYYEILVLEKGISNYSSAELYFGPFLLKKKSKDFMDKYKSRLKKLESIIDGITDKNKKEELTKEIELIKGLFK